MSQTHYMNNIISIGISAADAVENAIQDDLKFLKANPLSENEVQVIRNSVGKLVRQMVRSRFVPKTHMDL